MRIGGPCTDSCSSALTRELQEDVEVYRRLESDRLDALQVSLWDKAMAGDTAAAHKVVIRIIRERCRLLGLDLRRKPSAAPPPARRTVVQGVDATKQPPRSLLTQSPIGGSAAGERIWQIGRGHRGGNVRCPMPVWSALRKRSR